MTMDSHPATPKGIPMTLIPLNAPNDSQLYVSQIIDNLPDLAFYFGADTETIVNYAQRHFKAPHRQWEWLTVRAMLRHALGPSARIEYLPTGKPQLSFKFQDSSFRVQDSGSKLDSDLNPVRDRQTLNFQLSTFNFISLSHSKTHAALLLSASPHVGVDIETVSPRILRLAQRIAQPCELPASFAALSDEDKARHLTILWTLKEATYKSLDDQSGVDLLKDITIAPTFTSADDLWFTANVTFSPRAGISQLFNAKWSTVNGQCSIVNVLAVVHRPAD